MGGSLQGILPSREECEGPHGLNPIMLGQQEKPCFPSNSATAAEICGSESPSLFFSACGRKNPPFMRVSADLTHVFPTPMRLSEQEWDLELPGASLGAKMIKSVGPGPNLMQKPSSPCSPSTVNDPFIRQAVTNSPLALTTPKYLQGPSRGRRIPHLH